MNSSEIEQWMSTRLAHHLKVPLSDIDRAMPFVNMGMDSLTLLTVTGELAERIGYDLPVQLIWEYPTIEALATHLASNNQAEEILIPPAQRNEPLPVSFSQERILRYANWASDNNTVLEKWMVKGNLDCPALERSFGDLVRRHEILRTTYTIQEGQFTQVVHSQGAVSFQVIDLTHEKNPEERALQLMREEDRRGFNLETGPLFHVTVMRLSPLDYRLLFNLHHILFDAASLEILNVEIGAFYEANLKGEPCRALPELPVQFADFAVWQRQEMDQKGTRFQTLMKWWKEYWDNLQMARAPQLPFRPKSPVEAPARVEDCVVGWEMSAALFDRIREFSRQEKVTYFTIFLAAFEIVLHRLSGEEKIVMATYVSDRNRREVKDLMGFFINLIAMGMDMAGQPSYREVLDRVRLALQQTTAYQELPFDQMIDGLQRESIPAPDVQVIFQLVRDAEFSFQLHGLETRRWRVVAISRVPWGLTMHVYHRADDDVKVILEFDPAIYDRAGVERMMRQYEETLETMLASTETRIVPFERNTV